jgi:hypothetical protein
MIRVKLFHDDGSVMDIIDIMGRTDLHRLCRTKFWLRHVLMPSKARYTVEVCPEGEAVT